MNSIIERLKNNTSAFGLMPEEMRQVAENIGRRCFERFMDAGEWGSVSSDLEFGKNDLGTVFRLHKDWECGHPESTLDAGLRCKWCEGCLIVAKPELQIGWAEYQVVLVEDIGFRSFYAVQFKHYQSKIQDCLDYVGFGGIKYKAPCECYGGGETVFAVSPSPEPCEKHGPWTPVAVRFWEKKR